MCGESDLMTGIKKKHFKMLIFSLIISSAYNHLKSTCSTLNSKWTKFCIYMMLPTKAVKIPRFSETLRNSENGTKVSSASATVLIL